MLSVSWSHTLDGKVEVEHNISGKKSTNIMSLNLIHNLQIKLSIFIYLTCDLKTHINKIQKKNFILQF
jgi:hypothetical protein